MSTPQQDALVALKTEEKQLQAIMSLFNKSDLAIRAAQEIAYLEAASQRIPEIRQCEPISVLLAVKAVLKQNLTLDPHSGLVYIKTRNVNVAPKGAQAIWKKALEIEPTANGRISFNRMCGRILDIKRPQVTKDEATGKVIKVVVELLVPSTPAPRWEEYEFDEDEFFRWRRASHKENRRAYDNMDASKKEGKRIPDDNTQNYANEMYFNFKGGIDPEFARAKAIKHALKKLGTNQNELKPGELVITGTMEPVVDIQVDKKASADGETKDNTYTSYEDVTNKGEQDLSADKM